MMETSKTNSDLFGEFGDLILLGESISGEVFTALYESGIPMVRLKGQDETIYTYAAFYRQAQEIVEGTSPDRKVV